MLLQPTLRGQSWGFCIGSFLFALGAVPGFASWAGSTGTNTVFFIGSWFFTGAALVQLILAGPMTVDVRGRRMLRADWLTASTQFFGTLLFNVSTGAAIHAHVVSTERHYVWVPDSTGSVAFLISGTVAIVGLYRIGKLNKPRSRDWISTMFNFVGCVAFGASAVGAYVSESGATADALLANTGTFIGALCFFAASALYLNAAKPELQPQAA
ncbi:hypothetical protein [Tomitella biformata]|uniref:hypothetical protein n=1 Tax=Tomitella biformata TaxID=630403 RepID=UPI000465C2C2|nr:hypothetical protein [Tomitella biformata]